MNLAQNRVNRTFLNSDEEHALIVLINMFKCANDTIRIFAGNLCKHIGNAPEYIEAISDFIERNGKVRILLNEYDAKYLSESNLFKRLSYYLSEGSDIKIKQTSAHPYLSKDPDKKDVHFTIFDETGYRIETDIEKRTAECNFNSPILSKKLANFFDNIFNAPYSSNVNLNEIFNNGIN